MEINIGRYCIVFWTGTQSRLRTKEEKHLYALGKQFCSGFSNKPQWLGFSYGSFFPHIDISNWKVLTRKIPGNFNLFAYWLCFHFNVDVYLHESEGSAV